MMVSTIRKILAFAGKEKANIWKSTALNFLYAIFNMLQVAAVYFIIIALVGNDRTGIDGTGSHGCFCSGQGGHKQI